MTHATPTILQVLPRLASGGVERGTVEMVEAITAAGWKALVASAGGAMVPHITHAGGEHITLPLHSKNPLIIRANAWRLAQLIKARQVSLIHARSRAPAWSAYFAAKHAHIPFVTTWHGVYGTEGFLKKHYNAVMLKSDCTIAVSKHVEDHILREYGADPKKIRLIHRGVDLKAFSPTAIRPGRIAELTKSWRLPEEHIPVILCPARITPIKGQHVLIDALAKIKDLKFLCILLGNDAEHEDYSESLKKQVIALGLEGRVRHVGATPYMTEAYQLSQLVVLPTIKPESFGRVSVEAQAMGRIVIATDHGGVRETLVPNETGYLVWPDNAQALADALRFALNRDEKMVAAMADYAVRFVHEHFSSDIMKAKTIAVYRELLK